MENKRILNYNTIMSRAENVIIAVAVKPNQRKCGKKLIC